MKKQYVFVYGTLKRGYSNHALLQGCGYLGVAQTVDKFAMYERGIPYVSKQENKTQIIGELYLVDELCLNNLDMLEGHPDWYKRELINVTCILNSGDFKTIKAWLYFNKHIPSSATQVTSGMYIR